MPTCCRGAPVCPPSTPTRVAHLEELIARYLAEPGDARFSAEQVSRAANDARPGALGDYSASTHLQGELLGAMLDLIIRDATASRRSMDDVTRAMLEQFSGPRGFTGRDIENTIAEVCGCSVTSLFDAYVRGAAPIEFNRYLDLAGLHMDVAWEKTDAPDLSVWGWMDQSDNTLRVGIADPASVWGRAGLHTGDQILGMNGVTSGSAAEFRDTLRRLHVGDTVAIEAKHSGAIRTATVIIASMDRPKVRISEVASRNRAPARGFRSLALIALCRLRIARVGFPLRGFVRCAARSAPPARAGTGTRPWDPRVQVQRAREGRRSSW